MTLVATYDQPEARVALVTTGLLTAGATIFSIQRAPTNVGPWTNIRGVSNISATTNSAQTWYDYEYDAGPGVTNYYRVVSRGKATFVNFGTVAQAYTGGPSTLTPGLPASLAVGDVMIMKVLQTGCNNDDGIWPPVISGWTLVSDSLRIIATYMRVATASEVAPTFNRTINSGLNTVESAQIAAFRYVRPVVLSGAVRQGAAQPAATNQIGFPALAALEDHSMYISGGYSNITWTSVAQSTGWTQIDDAVSTSRTSGGCPSSSSIVWQYLAQSGNAGVAADVMVVTGGSHTQFAKYGDTMALSYDPTNAPTSVLFSDDVDTPLAEVWLKDPLRPPRNRVVQVASPTAMKYVARSGLFDIKGRAEPVEISEIRRAESWTQRWVFSTFTEMDDLLELFEPGRTLFLHVPARGSVPDCPPWPRNLPGGYIYVGDVDQQTAPDAPIPGTFTAPVQLVAAVDPGIDYLEDPVP